MKLEEKNVEKALGLRQGLFSLNAGSAESARALSSTASFLNFLQWVAAGVFRRLRSGWFAVNETGAMKSRRNGDGRAEAGAVASDGLRNDMLWRREMLRARPT